MRKFVKRIVMLGAVIMMTVVSSSCLRQNYLIFEDGEFDGMEFSDYDLMQNAEIEMDDTDRNWCVFPLHEVTRGAILCFFTF